MNSIISSQDVASYAAVERNGDRDRRWMQHNTTQHNAPVDRHVHEGTSRYQTRYDRLRTVRVSIHPGSLCEFSFDNAESVSYHVNQTDTCAMHRTTKVSLLPLLTYVLRSPQQL